MSESADLLFSVRVNKHQEADVLVALDQLDGRPLYITGHSLGGALAVLALEKLNYSDIQGCFTFGALPVADKDWSNKHMEKLFQFVNGADIVPRVMDMAPSFSYLIMPPLSLLKRFLPKSLSGKVGLMRNYIKDFRPYFSEYHDFVQCYV